MTEASSSPRSARTIYHTAPRRGRGRTYALIGLALVVAILGAAAAWQVVSAPAIQSLSPTPGSHVATSAVTVRVTVDGVDRLRNIGARLDGRDVSKAVTADGDGLIVALDALSDGRHTISLTAGTGNLYRRSLDRDWRFTVDTSAPLLTVTAPVKNAVFTTTPVTVTGSTEPGATVSVEGTGGTTQAAADGSYSLPVVPADGRLTLRVQARDRAGNVGTATRRIVVDTTAPSLWAEDMATVKTATPRLSVNLNDAASSPRLKLSVDGEVLSNRRQTGSRLLRLGKLTEGAHTVLLVATDNVGHQSTRQLDIVVNSTEELGDATLTRGAIGEDVKALQKLLKRNHVYKGALSGEYDEATAKAVRSFQRRTNLMVDGAAGPLVLAALSGRIVVDQSELRLYFYLNGKLKFTYHVATGMPAYPTPNGTFRVLVMAKNPTWIPPDSPWAKGLEPIPPGAGNPLGTRWIGTSAPGVGIHGTNADWSIGSYASHGCIRMHIWEVEQLFEYVKVGMPVIIRW